jgi:hypothetical protein
LQLGNLEVFSRKKSKSPDFLGGTLKPLHLLPKVEIAQFSDWLFLCIANSRIMLRGVSIDFKKINIIIKIINI